MQELLTGYGDLFLLWCDTPWNITEAQSRELYAMIKRYQPACMVNSRIGNGMGDYASLGDNEIPKDRESLVMGDRFQERALGRLPLFESACTLNDTWGYKAFDQNWKDPAKVLEIKNHLNSMGINYLLNVGPDALGRIPSISLDILKKAAELEG